MCNHETTENESTSAAEVSQKSLMDRSFLAADVSFDYYVALQSINIL